MQKLNPNRFRLPGGVDKIEAAAAAHEMVQKISAQFPEDENCSNDADRARMILLKVRLQWNLFNFDTSWMCL